MIPRLVFLLLPLLLLAVPPAAASTGHYLPRVSDGFDYTESIALADGMGNYTGYSENTAITGSMGVTAVLPNGTESASYASATSWSNSTGSQASWTSSGTFTFSATNYHYVVGTDNQTGYANPSVWFYMNNSQSSGNFTILNSQLDIQSTAYAYDLGPPLSKTVQTIYAEGSGQFERNDGYGVFTASYEWKAYYDTSTGYIVGYLYMEQDSDGAGDGFTLTDQLYVTSTTYPLTAATATPATGAFPFLLVGLVVGIVVIVLLVVWIVIRSRHRPTLPRHSAGGSVSYGPPAGVPPPIRLTPSDQPAVQQVVLRETVKVNCRYCGALIDTTDAACPNCGAPRT